MSNKINKNLHMKTKSFFFTLLTGLFFMQNTQAQIAEKAEDIAPLLIGESIPDSKLKNSKGEIVEISDILKKKPTVLVVYRGGWCPYCNLQLSGIGKIENEIIDLGYQIVAISPDDFQNLEKSEEINEIKYQLLSDEKGDFLQKLGIAFRTPNMVKAYIKTKKHIGETSEILPVPTVMIVNTEKEILFEYINQNYKQRISEEMLLAVLQTLKQ